MNGGPKTIDVYLKTIGQIPLLTPEEERQLARQAKQGDAQAKQRLIEANLRFVVKIAKGYRNRGLSFLDLIQEGNLGLIDSIDKFDETLGYRLTTYCGWWVRLAIQRAIEHKARPVKIPINKCELLRKMKAFSSDFRSRTGREPTSEELANHLQLPAEKVIELQKSEMIFFSLDTPLQADSVPLAASLPDARSELPPVQIFREESAARLESAMEILSAREKKVIQWRYGLNGKGGPASLRKIGGWIGLSAEGVRRVEEQAMNKLRRPGVRQRVEGLV